MQSEKAENCLKSGEADEFFLRRRNLQQNFGISIQHLIFWLLFLLSLWDQGKSDKKNAQSSNFGKS
jgi:hypothetical protein